MPKDGPTTKVEITLRRVLQKGNWSDTCHHLFRAILQSDDTPRTAPDSGLTSTWFFLRLLQDCQRNEFGNNPDGIDPDLFQQIPLDHLLEHARRRRSPTGGFDRTGSSNREIYITRELASILLAAIQMGIESGDAEQASRIHLLAAFILNVTEDDTLLSYLDIPTEYRQRESILVVFERNLGRIVRDNPNRLARHWELAIARLNRPNTGSNSQLVREASTYEKALDVDSYAGALAMLIRQADGKEFTIGIFGHWGRGKTYLMDRTAEVLAPSQSEASPEQSHVGVAKWIHSRKNDLLGWVRGLLCEYLPNGIWQKLMGSCNPPEPASACVFEVVRFSAWKYPSRPEVWAHLYDTFSRKAFGGGLWESIPRRIRASMARYGILGSWGFALLWLMLIAAFGPWWWASTNTVALKWAGSVVGLVTASALYGWIKKSGMTVLKELLKTYKNGTSHAEKLGLQAAIGEDLTALLKGWMPSKGPRDGWLKVVLSLPVVLGMGSLLVFESDIRRWPFPLGGIPLGPLAGLTVLGFRWIFPSCCPERKCLLIVDDLDRCDPDHLLAVMESIKLMLEDPEVSRRVVCCMLVDEDILQHAILKKYGSILETQGKASLKSQYDAGRLFRENVEKLFTVHFRLPPLQEDDVRCLVAKFGLNEALPGPSSPPLQSPTPVVNANPAASAGAPGDPLSAIQPAKLYIGDGMRDWLATTGNSEVKLSSMERDAVSTALFLYLREKPKTLLVGPRSVRAFVFRYQFVRLILSKRGIIAFNPGDVISDLAQKTFDTPNASTPTSSKDPRIAAILEMVS